MWMTPLSHKVIRNITMSPSPHRHSLGKIEGAIVGISALNLSACIFIDTSRLVLLTASRDWILFKSRCLPP